MRLHAILVNSCSLAKANNVWELIDIVLQCKIFQGLAEESGQREVAPGTFRGGTGEQQALALQSCMWAERCPRAGILCPWKKQSVAKCSLLFLPLFHILMYMGSSIWIQNHDELKKGSGDFSSLFQRSMVQCYWVSHFQCNHLAQKCLSATEIEKNCYIAEVPFIKECFGLGCLNSLFTQNRMVGESWRYDFGVRKLSWEQAVTRYFISVVLKGKYLASAKYSLHYPVCGSLLIR